MRMTETLPERALLKGGGIARKCERGGEGDIRVLGVGIDSSGLGGILHWETTSVASGYGRIQPPKRIIPEKRVDSKV